MSAVGPWGDLQWSTDERGCKDASWGISLPRGRRTSRLYRGALVEVSLGPEVLWSGVLDEPDWPGGEMRAKGLSYMAEGFLARDGLGAPTSTPSVAVDRAIDEGWPVTRGDSIPTAAFTAEADGSNTVGALLESQADQLGQFWSVRADRVLRMEVADAAMTWHITPGVVDLGNASDEYASAIHITFLNPGGLVTFTTRSNAAALARFGPKEVSLDLTSLGNITLAQAEDYGDGLLAKGAGRLGWTSAIEVTADELLSAGGVRAVLPAVRSLQGVRIHALYDDLQYLDGRTYLEVNIGSTSYVAESGVLTIGPLGSVAQTLSEAISELTERSAA